VIEALLAFLGGPLLQFLGGAAFRMIWGEVSAWKNKKLEHEQELERLEAQERFAAAQHERNLANTRLTHELGIREIEVRSQANLAEIDAMTFLEGVRATTVHTGVRLIDAWNAAIRPGVATWAVVMLTVDACVKSITLPDATLAVCNAALGLFLADRTLAKSGRK
jgi:hypothetical protein